MAPELAWATHDGDDWLVCRGCSPETLGELRSLPPAAMARALRVLPSEVLRGGPGFLQPMAGRYTFADGEIRFAPRFPFVPGISYTMLVAGQPAVRITRPGVDTRATTEVVEVHPTALVLPHNALRFYVHFSASMSVGLAARYVHLELDDSGERIAGPFSPLDPELWDPHRRRLTVLLDPARIKRGLAPHREAGYPLQEGAAVVLVVEREFPDGAGRPLLADFRRRYEVGPDVRQRVDPMAWALDLPTAGSHQPLVARFDRPLDRVLLEPGLMVISASDTTILGAVEVADGEESWSLIPDQAWAQGSYRLLVDPVLEDVAGNSVVRVFDRELDRPEHAPLAATDISLPFVVV